MAEEKFKPVTTPFGDPVSKPASVEPPKGSEADGQPGLPKRSKNTGVPELTHTKVYDQK